MEFPTLQFTAKIDAAQGVCLSALLGIFSVLIFAISLILGIAGAAIVIGFTALKVSTQYAAYIIALLQQMRPAAKQEPIILGPRRVYRRRPAYETRWRSSGRLVVRRYYAVV